MGLSENIKRLRKLREFSQEDVSRKLGIPRTTYATYEAGIEPKNSILTKIAKILEVDLTELTSDHEVHDDEKGYKPHLTDKESSQAALNHMFIVELGKLRAKVFGVSVDDAIDELEQNARIALRQLEKRGGAP